MTNFITTKKLKLKGVLKMVNLLSLIISTILVELIAHDWPFPARIALHVVLHAAIHITLHYVIRELPAVVSKLFAQGINIRSFFEKLTRGNRKVSPK